jgi:hypothetical protein
VYRKWLVRTHLISRWQNLSRWWLATTFKIIEKHHFYFKVSGEALEYHVHLSWLFARWILYNYHPSMSWTWRFVKRLSFEGWQTVMFKRLSFEGWQTVMFNSYLGDKCFITPKLLCPILYSVHVFYACFSQVLFLLFFFFFRFFGGWGVTWTKWTFTVSAAIKEWCQNRHSN